MAEEMLEFEADELERFIRKYMELDRGVQQPRGIYSILRGPREQQYQQTLKYFLDPQKPHGFDSRVLATFLNAIGFDVFNLRGQHVEVVDEVRVADESSDDRIDLVICGGSALSDHPTWAVFVELKVGAEEGEGQAAKYAEADRWNVSWFDSGEIAVDDLDEQKYVYLKRWTADSPAEEDEFDVLNWQALVDTFEAEIGGSLAEYPNRSVVQFRDFIQSLKETERMDTGYDETELNDRLQLYFEHQRLIKQVEQANSQFESDFEEVSSYLTDSWESRLGEKFDFQHSGWKTSPSSNAKWQGILPEYWHQDPLDRSSTIKLYYRHAPTTDALRNRTLTFRLRLPPSRNVHTEVFHEGLSFNEVFAEKCTGEYHDRMTEALEELEVDEYRLGSASALVTKDYDLDPQDLTGSYFDRLERAVTEFCSDDNGLLQPMNEIFEETYREVFVAEPEGSFPGSLPRLK